MTVTTLKTAASPKINLNIEANVPLPASRALLNRIPWDQIKVGDSFAVTTEAFGERPVERLRTAIDYRSKLSAHRYSVRKNELGEYRCWRVA